MGGLDIVEEDHVFQLHRVAHHGLLAHDGAAPDEGAVADLRPVVNDAGAADVSRGKHLGVLGDPHVLGGVVKLLRREGGPQLEDKVAELSQHLPGVGLALEERGGDGVV